MIEKDRFEITRYTSTKHKRVNLIMLKPTRLRFVLGFVLKC